MDTVLIKTKEASLSYLPYIDEQRFYFRTRGKGGVLYLSFWISTENEANQSQLTIKGGEFLDSWQGNTLGDTITVGSGGHNIFVKILVDKAYLSFRNSDVVVGLGYISSAVASNDFCLQRNIDGDSTPYIEINISDLPYNITSLMSVGAATYGTSKQVVAFKGDINLLAGYPSLGSIGIGTAYDNGTLELTQLSGTLTSKLQADTLRFFVFPNMQGTNLIYDKIDIHLSAFSQCNKMTDLAICGVKVHGVLSEFSHMKSLKELRIDTPSNNITGNFSDLKNMTSLKHFRYQGQQNIQGGLNHLPENIELLVLNYQSSMSSYTTRSWGNTMQGILIPRCQLSTSEINQLLIDLTKVTTWSGSKTLQLKGTPGSTGLAAITTLQAKGVTVTLY